MSDTCVLFCITIANWSELHAILDVVSKSRHYKMLPMVYKFGFICQQVKIRWVQIVVQIFKSLTCYLYVECPSLTPTEGQENLHTHSLSLMQRQTGRRTHHSIL